MFILSNFHFIFLILSFNEAFEVSLTFGWGEKVIVGCRKRGNLMKERRVGRKIKRDLFDVNKRYTSLEIGSFLPIPL